MKTELLPTQLEDIEKIVANGDLPNFSKAGTGKTLTSIGVLERLTIQSGIVVCPPIAVYMWIENLQRELGCRAQWVKSPTAPLDKLADFHVVSNAIVAKAFSPLWGREAQALIVDESQYMKSREAKRTKAVFGPDCDGHGGLFENSDICLCLSGTPIERYADDLWTQIRATQPKALYRRKVLEFADFQRQFCRVEYKEYYGQGKIVSAGNTNEMLLNHLLYKEIGIIRRTIDEVEEFMPPVTENVISFRLKVSRELQKRYENLTLEQIEDELEALANSDSDSKWSIVRRLVGEAKAETVADYITSVAREKQVLVGFWHQNVGKELQRRLQRNGVQAGIIGGQHDVVSREHTKRAFIDGDITVLLGQIQAMGVAMDGLQQVANHVIFAELDWSAAKMEQFYKRLSRKGQKQHTQVDYCVADITPDTAIYNVARRKEIGVNQIFEKSS